MLLVFLHARRRLQPLWSLPDELPVVSAAALEEAGWLPPGPWVRGSHPWLSPGLDDELPSGATPGGLDEAGWTPPLPWGIPAPSVRWRDDDLFPTPASLMGVEAEGWLPPLPWAVQMRRLAAWDDELLPPAPVPFGLDEGFPWQSPTRWARGPRPQAFLVTDDLSPVAFGLQDETWHVPIFCRSWVWFQVGYGEEEYPTPAVPFGVDDSPWFPVAQWHEWESRGCWVCGWVDTDVWVEVMVPGETLRGRVIPMQRRNQSLQSLLIEMRRS
jgi:hypothetical protein